MNVLIAGGTGFVGRFLSEYLLDAGCRVIALGRRPQHPLKQSGRFAYLAADTSAPGSWQDQISHVDAIVNLAGKNIFHYWTDKSKQQMRASRIGTTKNLVAAMPDRRPPALVSASAIGYYGDRGEERLTEAAAPGSDFLAQLSQDWEKEALLAEKKGARVALLRFGIVLGRQGGALAKMLPAFRYGAGGPLGSGRQWFSWIHIRDLAAAVSMVLQHRGMAGAFNLCAPQPVRNRDYSAALGQALGRPAFMRVPALVIKLFMGELGSVMLSSQRCVPERLEQFRFEFRFPRIERALADLT